MTAKWLIPTVIYIFAGGGAVTVHPAFNLGELGLDHRLGVFLASLLGEDAGPTPIAARFP